MWAQLQKLAISGGSDGLFGLDARVSAAGRPMVCQGARQARHSVARPSALTTLRPKSDTVTVSGGPTGSSSGCKYRVDPQLFLEPINSTDRAALRVQHP